MALTRPLLAAACVFWAVAAPAQEVVLTRDGRARACLVLPDQPLAGERFAAAELQTYLEKMSGAKLEIARDSQRPKGTVVTIGATRDVPAELLAGLGVEECVLRTVGADRLVIMGGRKPPVRDAEGREWVRDRGTLYGVYELLHRLGVRWYDPSPLGEVVPSRATVSVGPLDYRHAPAFPYRAGFGGLWAVRNRYCGNVWGPPEWGGIWYEWLAHMYQYIVPPDPYFQQKPEWFPLRDGARTATGQLCLTSPGLVDRFVDFVLSSYRATPQLQVLGIEANDGAGWCECESCRRADDPQLLTPYRQLSMSPRVVALNAEVARRVAERNPQAVVGWYIYSDHTEVPRGLTSLPENLHGRICTYASSYSDYSQPIATGASPPNRRLREVFEGYRKLLRHLSTYEYWSGYNWFGPMPIRKTIAANLRYYRRLGLEGCYQLGPEHWATQGLNYWLAGRLLWDPDESEDALLDDYCRGLFGPAAEPMKRYHLRLERAVADSGRAVMSGGAYIEPIFTEAVLADAQSRLDEAFRQAGTPIVRARIERVHTGLEFTRRATKMARLEERGQLEEALGEGRDLLAWMNGLHPDRQTFAAQFERRSQEIKALGEAGKLGEAAAKARELQAWLAKLAEGSFTFAAMDSEPGANLTARVARLAETVRDFARLVSLCDVVCEAPAEWRFHTDPSRAGEKAGWFRPDYDDASWARIPIGVWWENAGYPGYDGLAWYRTVVRPPKAFEGRQVQAFFGAVDGDAVVYLNGQEVGRHLLGPDGKGWDEAFAVDLTPRLRLGVDNVLAVSVLDEAAYGGIWKAVRIVSPRPEALMQGRLRRPLTADAHTVLLLDFNEPTPGWMANEKYGEGAFPGQKDRNLAAWFDAPDKPQTGLRLNLTLPSAGAVECWAKPTGLQPGHSTLFSVGTVGNTKLGAYLGRDGRVRALIVRKDASETLTSAAALPDSQWTHVAVTWGPEAPLRLWLNGKLEVEGQTLGSPYACAADALYLGCQPWWEKDAPDHTAWNLDLNLRGLLDDFRVSNVVREQFQALGPPGG